MRWTPSGTHTHTRLCVVSHRPLQGYSQPHKILPAPNDAAWASFDWSTNQPLLGPWQHLLQDSSTMAQGLIDSPLLVFSFFLNEDSSCHEDHWNPWRLALLGNDCPASILSHCHSLQNCGGRLNKLLQHITAPPFSSICFFFPLWHISKWKKKTWGVQFQGNTVFYTIFTCHFVMSCHLAASFPNVGLFSHKLTFQLQFGLLSTHTLRSLKQKFWERKKRR